MPIYPEDASYDKLIEAWLSAIEPFADLADSLTDEQWQAESVLPGWTNADIVAHVVGIERDLLGEPLPTVEPNWDSLPHADDLFSRYTEFAVDIRRGTPADEVRAELRKAIAGRRDALALDRGSLGEIIRGPGGWELPRGIVLRMRCFDIWVHNQDIRAGIGEPGDLDSAAARVTADRMLQGLARAWVKKMGAGSGDVLRLVVTEPGLEFAADIVVDEANRAQVDVAEPTKPATVTITTDWPNFVALTCGRSYLDRRRVEVSGDADTVGRVLEHSMISI